MFSIKFFFLWNYRRISEYWMHFEERTGKQLVEIVKNKMIFHRKITSLHVYTHIYIYKYMHMLILIFTSLHALVWITIIFLFYFFSHAVICLHYVNDNILWNTYSSLQRLLRMLDTLNFKEFVAFLSAFSPRASLQQKIECNYSLLYLYVMNSSLV